MSLLHAGKVVCVPHDGHTGGLPNRPRQDYVFADLGPGADYQVVLELAGERKYMDVSTRPAPPGWKP